MFIKDAKNINSPIHDCFEWDDTKAGHQWRLQQARIYLAATVQHMQIDDKPVLVKSFYNVVNKKGERVYTTVENTVNTKFYLKQIVRDVRQYASYFINQLELLEKHL